MRHFKTVAIALAIMVGTSAFANSEPAFKPKKSTKSELQHLLQDKFLLLEKDLYCKVVFTLDSEKRINVNSILSGDPFVREYLITKMKDQQLEGVQWEAGKTYILPVRMKAI